MLEMVSQRDIARLVGVNDITIHRWKKTGVLEGERAEDHSGSYR